MKSLIIAATLLFSATMFASEANYTIELKPSSLEQGKVSVELCSSTSNCKQLGTREYSMDELKTLATGEKVDAYLVGGAAGAVAVAGVALIALGFSALVEAEKVTISRHDFFQMMLEGLGAAIGDFMAKGTMVFGGGVALSAGGAAFLLRKQFQQNSAMTYVLSSQKAGGRDVLKTARLVDELLCDLK